MSVNGVNKRITYAGGDGNDVVLLQASGTPPTGITAFLVGDVLVVVGTGLSDNIVLDQLVRQAPRSAFWTMETPHLPLPVPR